MSLAKQVTQHSLGEITRERLLFLLGAVGAGWWCYFLNTFCCVACYAYNVISCFVSLFRFKLLKK